MTEVEVATDGLNRFGFAAAHLDVLMPRAEGDDSVPDEEWMRHVGTYQWIALCLNPHMCRNQGGSGIVVHVF